MPSLLTIKQVAFRIIVIVTLAEFLVMLILATIHQDLNIYYEALLDALLLAVLSTPPIYIWVIKPFVAARDDALEEISHLAFTDHLTQLANRRLLIKHLEKIIASSYRHCNHAGLLLIDLDGFKQVNDTHGHDAGDAVLVEISNRLKSITRTEDIVGRLGGDEFVIIINQLGTDIKIARDKIELVAKKLLSEMEKIIEFEGAQLKVGASVGVRLLGDGDLEVETAIDNADSAMYRAKQAGRGCARFFE